MAIAMSTIAKRGGSLSFNFPGDFYHATLLYGQTSGSIQGWKDWRYGYANRNNGAISWHNMGLNRSNHTSTASGKIASPFFNARGECHPNATYMNVLRWRAPRAGKIRVQGQIMDANRAGGNSVYYWVGKMKTLDGRATTASVSQWICNPKTGGNQGTVFNVGSINVSRGTCIYAVVDSRGDGSYDTTVIKMSIYYESCSDLDGLNMSLGSQTLQMGKYSAIMPNYYVGNKSHTWANHGQNAKQIAKTPSYSTGRGLSMLDWKDTTLVPVIHRSGTTRDTHWYASVGNGTLNVDMVYGPNGAQWWGTATTVRSSMQLYNYAPPSIKKWPSGVKEKEANSGTNVAANFSGLVGGNYAVGAVIVWKVNGRQYSWNITDGYSTIPAASLTFVNRGLTAYTYANK